VGVCVHLPGRGIGGRDAQDVGDLGDVGFYGAGGPHLSLLQDDEGEWFDIAYKTEFLMATSVVCSTDLPQYRVLLANHILDHVGEVWRGPEEFAAVEEDASDGACVEGAEGGGLKPLRPPRRDRTLVTLLVFSVRSLI